MIDTKLLRAMAAGDDELAEVVLTKRLLRQIVHEIDAGRTAHVQLQRQTSIDAVLLDISGTVTG